MKTIRAFLFFLFFCGHAQAFPGYCIHANCGYSACWQTVAQVEAATSLANPGSYCNSSQCYIYTLHGFYNINTCSSAPVVPTCMAPEVLQLSTNTCVTPPTCTAPQVLKLSTNTCAIPPTCTAPQYLNTTTFTCVTCTAPQVLDTNTNTCVTPPTCTAPQVLDTNTNTCVTPVVCPHTYLGVETSSGWGFTTQDYAPEYIACDSYGCAVKVSTVAQALGVTLARQVALNYACPTSEPPPPVPLTVTLSSSDPSVTNFIESGTVPQPLAVTCSDPLVLNPSGDGCMYPDQSPAPVTCVAPMVLNAMGTACLNSTPEAPPDGSPPETPSTCSLGMTMSNGVCVPNAAPVPGTSGNPTTVTGSVTVQFPGDYAKTGEAAAAAAGLGAKLDTLHGDLTGSTDVADPEVLTAADMPGMGSTFDGIKAWTLPAHTSTCPQPQIDLSGVLGVGRTFTLSAHCQIAQDNLAALQAAMMVMWTIAAMFTVLRA